VRARSKHKTRWGRCRVIASMSMLYMKIPEPNKNCIETGEEKSKQKGQILKKAEESGRKKFAGNCSSPGVCHCINVTLVMVFNLFISVVFYSTSSLCRES
jgi:hypothetical protein